MKSCLKEMAPKIDVGVVLLVSITILQVAYTSWSVFGGQSTASHYKSSYSIAQQKVNADIKLVTNPTKLVLGHGRKVSTMRYKHNRGSDNHNSALEDQKGILNVLKSYHNDPNSILLSDQKLSSSDKLTLKHKTQNIPPQNLRSVGSDAQKSGSRNSQFVLDKPNVCDDSPLVVIIVCSACENSMMRDAIRQTWASQPEPDVTTLFLVGRHGNASIDDSISSEDDVHHDVIRMDFVDSYANLSLKSTLMLNWTMSHCSSAKFLVKTDDDTFLNTPLLIRDLRKTVHTRFIMGNVIALAKPVRTPNQKWFTSLSAFNRSAYPTYVSGAAYVISGDAVSQLYSASRGVPLFWLEDVYVTGLLAGSARIPLIFNGKFDGFKEFSNVLCSLRFHIVRHRISAEQMVVMWKTVRSNFTREQCT